MKRLLALMGLLTTCLLIVAPAVGASDQKPIRLKMATQYMDRHPVYQSVWKSWIQEIKKRTNGRLIITYYNCNTICPDAEILDTTLKGQIDIGDMYLTRNPGRFPLSMVTNKIPLPASSTLATSMALWELWSTTPEIKAEFNGLKIFALHQSATVQLSTKDKPVHKLEDIKGLRLATAGKDSFTIAKALGATTIMQHGPDLYLALSRNMAEGVIYPIPPMRSFKVNEATKYTTIFDFLSSPCWFGMNQEKWDSLPPDIQKILEETIGEVMTKEIGKALDAGVEQDMAIMKKEGQEFIFPSSEERSKVASLLTPILKDSWLKELVDTKSSFQNPDSLYQKACDLMKKYDAVYGRK